MQVQRETSVRMLDAALREYPFQNEVTSCRTSGFHWYTATFGAHCPHQAGRLDTWIENRKLWVLGGIPAAERLILTKWKLLMKWKQEWGFMENFRIAHGGSPKMKHQGPKVILQRSLYGHLRHLKWPAMENKILVVKSLHFTYAYKWKVK